MTTWLKDVRVYDLHRSRGNGPFNRKTFKGCVAHVNVSRAGTPDSFWKSNSDQVTPNVQIYKHKDDANAGGHIIHQMLPINWQPWCQIAGNFTRLALEFAGMPDEPMTDDQLAAGALVLAQANRELGMKLVVDHNINNPGLCSHKDGGAAWGGHACPGRIREAQLGEVIRLAKRRIRPATPPKPKPAPIVPQPAPHPTGTGRPTVKVPRFPLRAGHYFGDYDGPARSHGGINHAERVQVQAIQKRLRALGWYAGKTDGVFDRGGAHPLADSVRRFQKASGIKQTGEVGRRTWAALFATTAKRKG